MKIMFAGKLKPSPHTAFNRRNIVQFAAYVGVILLIIYLANTGQGAGLFRMFRRLPHGDKIGHFMLFGILAFMANRALCFKTITVGRFKVLVDSIWVILFAAVEELSQHYIDTRSLDVYDFLADVAGVWVFARLSNKRV
ncbi:MAG: VanZ family protein [Gammaproteobacteria bacterium]|nr:VanZ family protein [Gammaproteobacteria bacterium]